MPASFDIGGNTGSAQELRKKFTSGDFLKTLGGDRKERERYTNALTHRESGGRYGRAFDPPTAESPGGPKAGATDVVQVRQVVEGPVGTDTIDPAAEIRAENQRRAREEDERRALEEDEARKSRDEEAAREEEAAAAVREALAAADAARAKDAKKRTANLATEQAAGNTTVANDIVANTRATSAPETDEALDLLVNQRGFSDDKIRQSQQGTVNQLIRQAETAGQQAGSSLEQPVFKQDVLGAQLQRGFLQDLLGGRGGQDDAISKAERSRFDADAESKRAQLTEDLQRFGILGGNGVSAGAGADVFGKFDAGIAQGGLDIGANQQARRQSNIENAILPFQQQQNDLRQRQSEFGFGANQSRIGTQQDVADRTLKRLLTATDVTEREQFEQGVQQEGVENTRADTEMFGSQLGSGRKTLATRELEQQATQAGLNREFQGGESALDRDFQGRESAFDRTARRDEFASDRGERALDRGLEQERITNQGTQFASQLFEQKQNRIDNERARLTEQGFTRDQIDNQMSQFEDSLGQEQSQFESQLFEQKQNRIDNERARLTEQGFTRDQIDNQVAQFAESIEQEEAGRTQQQEQFLQSLGLQGEQLDLAREQLSQSGSQFDRSLGQSGSQFSQSLAEQQAGREQSGSQFDRSLGQSGSQFSQSLAEQQAGREQAGSQFSQGLEDQQAARTQQGEQFLQSLGLQGEQLALAREQLAQSGSQFDLSLGEQQASREQQGSQFQSAQEQDTAQFAQSLGLDFERMSQQDRQFFAGLAEQETSREQQQGQFDASQLQQGSQFDASQLQQQGQFDASQLQQGSQFDRGINLSEEQANRQAFQEYMANVQGLSQLDNKALGNISTLTGGPAVVSMPEMLDRLGITNPNARP